MENGFDIWLLLAGLGIFLFGMMQIEESLRLLAGRTFKLFLQRQTSSAPKAILGGTVVTAILQSSSALSLMVLSFAGAGIIGMRNAFAIIIGANLGTTLSNWVFAILGFKIAIESFAYPLIALALLGFIFLNKNKKALHWSRFLFGFSLLFIGLNYMKNGVSEAIAHVDIGAYDDQPLLVFALIGFAVTAIIQSSSATMVITLTSLNAGIIPFESAVGVVIGSELGTSMKLILSSLGSTPDKKRVSLGNFLYNCVTTLLAIALMGPLIWFIVDVLGVNDPLTGLVAFQTGMNLLSIFAVYPFLNIFGAFLEKRFLDETDSVSAFISKATPEVGDDALKATGKEAEHMILMAIRYNCDVLGVSLHPGTEPGLLDKMKTFFTSAKASDNYNTLKFLEGEIHHYAVKINTGDLDAEETEMLQQYLFCVQSAMHAAKEMKDIAHNLLEFCDSAEDIIYRHYLRIREQETAFYSALLNILNNKDSSSVFEGLAKLRKESRDLYEKNKYEILAALKPANLENMSVSSLLNANRGIYSSRKEMIQAAKYLRLKPQQAKDLELADV